MSGVEALEQNTEIQPDGGAPGAIGTVDTSAADGANLDSELDAIWDRENVTNGADRGEGGKFVSAGADNAGNGADGAETGSLEGGKAAAELPNGSTPAAAAPLPANRLLNSLDAEWATLTPEVQAKLTERSNELHTRLTQMGQQVSTFKPLQEAASEFAEYFNGNLVGADGQAISPADGIRYLVGIQKAMDTNPLQTLLSIADTYNLRADLAKVFGGQVQAVPVEQQQILSEIAGIKQVVGRLQSPANVEEVIERREFQAELSRFAEAKPHWEQVVPDLPFFITKAKTQLGENAGRTAILEKAYDLAVQADPALRAQTEAAKTAAKGSAAKAEGAKRAAGVNVASTPSGKAREPSLDDALGAIWDENNKG